MRTTLDMFGTSTTYDTTHTVDGVLNVLRDNPSFSYDEAVTTLLGYVERARAHTLTSQQSPERFHILWYLKREADDLTRLAAATV